jgi:hypothetical protein
VARSMAGVSPGHDDAPSGGLVAAHLKAAARHLGTEIAGILLRAMDKAPNAAHLEWADFLL